MEIGNENAAIDLILKYLYKKPNFDSSEVLILSELKDEMPVEEIEKILIIAERKNLISLKLHQYRLGSSIETSKMFELSPEGIELMEDYKSYLSYLNFVEKEKKKGIKEKNRTSIYSQIKVVGIIIGSLVAILGVVFSIMSYIENNKLELQIIDLEKSIDSKDSIIKMQSEILDTKTQILQSDSGLLNSDTVLIKSDSVLIE